MRPLCSSVLLLFAACGRLGFGEESALSPDGGGPSVDGFVHITIERLGSGTGTIVGPAGFTCSAARCEAVVTPGTAMWLRAVPANDAWFAGWTGLCGGNLSCTFDATTSLTLQAEFAPIPNRVFVTSIGTNGAIGGIAGADALCAARATAGGLSGNFIAFLSDSTTNSVNRISSSRGWIRIDGAPFADAPTAFASGNLVFPPRLDEYGNDVGSDQVFTGINAGSVTANTCLDWTSSSATEYGFGALTQFASRLTSGWDQTCDSSARLLCVEVGRIVPVEIHPDTTTKQAFATTGTWTPGNGRGSADALCASEASGAGLSGSFLAALATSTETIASRFSASAQYHRVDGVRLFDGPGLLSADFLDVPPELDARGDRVENDYWTGATRFNKVAAGTDSCNDWSTGSNLVSGAMHYTGATDVRDVAKYDPCSTSLPVLCLEQ
ncbi:MAG: hypothetical protein IPQ07_32665 [Myxococcales bacterium]|nr:hypothetical protein [Myxococcales bacterium]